MKYDEHSETGAFLISASVTVALRALTPLDRVQLSGGYPIKLNTISVLHLCVERFFIA